MTAGLQASRATKERGELLLTCERSERIFQAKDAGGTKHPAPRTQTQHLALGTKCLVRSETEVGVGLQEGGEAGMARFCWGPIGPFSYGGTIRSGPPCSGSTGRPQKILAWRGCLCGARICLGACGGDRGSVLPVGCAGRGWDPPPADAEWGSCEDRRGPDGAEDV